MENPDSIYGELEKQIVKNRYQIGRHLDNGSNGMIHKVVDTLKPKTPLVIKLSDNCK